MDPQLDARLSAIEKKLDENSAILAQLHRAQRNANLVKIGYWAVVIIVGIISLWFIKPYLSELGGMYGIGGTTSGTSGSYADQIKQLTQ